MTPPPAPPTRGTAAGRAYNDLRTLAKQRARDSSEYFTLYALEGLLARLAVSENATDFILKGGMLMAAFTARRPTRDIDLSVSGIPNEVEEVARRIRSVVAIDTGDGLSFDPKSVSGAPIRDDAIYAGVRLTMSTRLATARIRLHIDVNFGDPIWPAPAETELPLLLGGTLRLRGYPDHMVLAEKIVTAVERGEANTRWRDFVDIVAITSTRSVRRSNLATAIAVVASHRQVTMQPLTTVLRDMPNLAQPKWAAWRRRQRLEAATPERFNVLLDLCSAFTDPVLSGGEADGLVWSPEHGAWCDEG